MVQRSSRLVVTRATDFAPLPASCSETRAGRLPRTGAPIDAGIATSFPAARSIEASFRSVLENMVARMIAFLDGAPGQAVGEPRAAFSALESL
jgi:hypothetical protein